MARGTVVIYLSQLGGRLRTHQEAMLIADAKAIADIKEFEFAGDFQKGTAYPAPLFFVPDDTLLVEEARGLGIRDPAELYGGVVPYPFVKSKAITHPLVSDQAARPEGWVDAFAQRVRDIVLPGYSAFNARDARIAVERMLEQDPARLKRPLGSEGKGQAVITTIDQFDGLMKDLSTDDVETYGVVIEADLRSVKTRSVGQILIDDLTMSYHGTQRLTTDNKGRTVYGGSDLTCARGGWDALGRLSLTDNERDAVTQARRYEEAMSAYPGFMASRRNYDVAEGIGHDGRRHCGVLESSWRVGGATGAEVLALAALQRDPSLSIVQAAHTEEFGSDKKPPEAAIVHFHGDDPRVGPVLRYTIVLGSARPAEA